MSSANHAHSTTRRTMLVGLAAAPVMQTTPAASASPEPSSAPAADGPNLLDLWHERCRLFAEWQGTDELTQKARYYELDDKRRALDQAIDDGEITCDDDALAQAYLHRFQALENSPLDQIDPTDRLGMNVIEYLLKRAALV